jgi:hypothetical protein
LKRFPIAEVEGYDVPLWHPMMEVYLDVSGSMPDPRATLNAMTLAGLILVTAAIRKGGSARACLYSTDTVPYWQWCRSEVELSKFLMHYIGGGTKFPFARLAASLEECGDNKPTRVVITDSDFNLNFSENRDARGILRAAAMSSQPFVMLLHNAGTEAIKIYRDLGANVVPIADLENFPKMASQLVTALFPDERATVER